MKDIIFKKDCEFNGKTYFEGDVIELENVKKEHLKEIWSLNEKGFIETISYKDFVKFSNSLNNPKTTKRKDELDV